MNKKLYDLMNWCDIEAIVYSEADHPEETLGPKKVRGGYLVQAFYPDAKSIFLKLKKGGKMYPMEEADSEGVFAVLIPEKKLTPYTFVISYEDGSEIEREDPYLYTNLMGANDLRRFENGIHYSIYDYLGAHTMVVSGCMNEAEPIWDALPEQAGAMDVYGTHFAVWAPNAVRVSVVGDFNMWDGRCHQMCRRGDSGVFELFIPNVGPGQIYKYEIKLNYKTVVLKTDPYGFACEQRPANASVICHPDYKWKDDRWLAKREKDDFRNKPVSVYEVHLGSWKKKTVQSQEPTCDEEFYNYRELAPLLVEYVKKMNYTHIELMPVMEHPLDESWGYQVTGYYAVTSRYGTPEDFMFFVDYMHQHQIGVILDWVPAHFPKDANGLAKFDGTCLYEHFDPRQGEHPHWGTLIYNYGRPQVANFLIANALFWVKRYHVDGIRMDAVASMLYLDYGKQDGEWVANIYGSNENLEAISMLQHLSKVFHKECPGAWLIAEESTAWPKVTGDVQEDGLGFDLKWNMGWMNDFVSYMQTDPLFRKGRHGMLTFSMIYAYSEKFILVLSHDEVVHMKGSMLMKMPGDMEQKFANLRVSYGFMMAHPGKKLLFMGQEFAQTTEWNEKISLPWEEAEKPEHARMQEYVSRLNAFYQNHPALYDNDYKEEGFEWLSSMDADHSIISFMRYSADRSEQLLVVCNFTPVLYENFKLGVPFPGKYKEIFNSDAEEFGGSGHVNRRLKNSKPVTWDGRENSISVEIPPLGISIYQCDPARGKSKSKE